VRAYAGYEECSPTWQAWPLAQRYNIIVATFKLALFLGMWGSHCGNLEALVCCTDPSCPLKLQLGVMRVGRQIFSCGASLWLQVESCPTYSDTHCPVSY
jgi:hypothetical protein